MHFAFQFFLSVDSRCVTSYAYSPIPFSTVADLLFFTLNTQSLSTSLNSDMNESSYGFFLHDPQVLEARINSSLPLIKDDSKDELFMLTKQISLKRNCSISPRPQCFVG